MFTPEGAVTPWLRGAGWSQAFPMKVPFQDKVPQIPRQLGLGEADLSNIENWFRAQSGHTLIAILYQCWGEPTFFSLPIINSPHQPLHSSLSGFFQALALPALSNQCGCGGHTLTSVSA